jgi:hypothetical protein
MADTTQLLLQTLDAAIASERAKQSPEEEQRAHTIRSLMFERDRVAEIDERLTRIESFFLR